MPANPELDAHFRVAEDQLAYFNENGFIKLKHVLSPEVLDRYGPKITQLALDQDPRRGQALADKDTYGQAFIQVVNLWLKSHLVREFVFGQRLARIATELLGTTGVRLWHDQALYKEAGGGITPWHADQVYWPLESDRSVTAWIPLQPTPAEMGPLAFAAGSQRFEHGRELRISDESERVLQEELSRADFETVSDPFDLGDISFHLGWTYHRAEPNTTAKARKVMTIIYVDENMRIATPRDHAQEQERLAFAPDSKAGEIVDSPLTPILWSETSAPG